MNKGLILGAQRRDLKPESATAIFPAQNLIEKEEETTYNFGGPEITLMRLRGGDVIMTVYSTIEEEIIFDYEVPESKHVQTKENIHKIFKIPPAENGVPSKFTERFPIGDYEILYKGKDPYNPAFYQYLFQYTWKQGSNTPGLNAHYL